MHVFTSFVFINKKSILFNNSYNQEISLKWFFDNCIISLTNFTNLFSNKVIYNVSLTLELFSILYNNNKKK